MRVSRFGEKDIFSWQLKLIGDMGPPFLEGQLGSHAVRVFFCRTPARASWGECFRSHPWQQRRAVRCAGNRMVVSGREGLHCRDLVIHSYNENFVTENWNMFLQKSTSRIIAHLQVSKRENHKISMLVAWYFHTLGILIVTWRTGKCVFFQRHLMMRKWVRGLCAHETLK